MCPVTFFGEPLRLKGEEHAMGYAKPFVMTSTLSDVQLRYANKRGAGGEQL
jgi:hypothetical protein